MLTKIAISILFFLSLLSINADDEIIYYGKGTLSIPLRLNDYTYLKFERPILEFPGHTDLEVVKVGVNASTKIVRVKPLNPNLKIESVFILNDSTVVNINLYVDKKGLFSKPSYSLKQDPNARSLKSKGGGFIGLYKLMKRQNNSLEYKVLNQSYDYGEFNGVQSTIIRHYRGLSYNGMILILKNNNDYPVKFHPDKSLFHRANVGKYLAADDYQIEAGKKTLLFVVGSADFRPFDSKNERLMKLHFQRL